MVKNDFSSAEYAIVLHGSLQVTVKYSEVITLNSAFSPYEKEKKH